MGEVILELSNVQKLYDSNSGVKNINFILEKGKILGFLGQNGAGKSTTIKLIMNLVSRDNGEIKVFNLDNKLNEKEVKSKIGFVYDELYFDPTQTAEEARKVVRRFYSKWNDETFDYYMSLFELPYDKKIHKMSRGMKIKLNLSLALSHEAELLIMDEPTSGLDPVVRDDFLDILLEINKDKDKTILFSSHITSDVEKVADEIVIIHKGIIVKSSPKDRLLQTHFIVRGEQDLISEELKRMFIWLRKSGDQFVGLTDQIDYVRDYFNVKEIKVKRANLEEILLALIKGGNLKCGI